MGGGGARGTPLGALGSPRARGVLRKGLALLRVHGADALQQDSSRCPFAPEDQTGPWLGRERSGWVDPAQTRH